MKDTLDQLTRRKEEIMNEERCPACGQGMKTGIRVGSIRLCRLCASSGSVDIAVEIARSRHREKLEEIWASLQKAE